MATTFESYATANAATGTSVAVTKPTGTATNDLLVAFVTVRASGVAIDTPSGWTLEDSGSVDATGWVLLSKLATAADGASYTFTWDLSGRHIATVCRISSVDTGLPIPGTLDETSAQSSLIIRCPTLNSALPDQLVLRFGVQQQGNETRTAPAGQTEQWSEEEDATTALSLWQGCATKSYTATGAVGVEDWTTTSIRPAVGVTVVIAKAPSGRGKVVAGQVHQGGVQAGQVGCG